jgi:hypothetical protein
MAGRRAGGGVAGRPVVPNHLAPTNLSHSGGIPRFISATWLKIRGQRILFPRGYHLDLVLEVRTASAFVREGGCMSLGRDGPDIEVNRKSGTECYGTQWVSGSRKAGQVGTEDGRKFKYMSRYWLFICMPNFLRM